MFCIVIVDLEQMFVYPWTKFIAFLMYLFDERRNSNFFGGHYPGQDTAINILKAHCEVLRLRSVFAKYPTRIHTFQQSDQLLKNIYWKLNLISGPVQTQWNFVILIIVHLKQTSLAT